MEKNVFFFVLIAILISGCGGVTPIPNVPEIVVTHPELEVINTENVGNLEEVDRWGRGYGSTVFSPDEKMMGFSTQTGIYIYNIATQKETVFVDANTQNEDSKFISYEDVPAAIDFSVDGSRIAVASRSLIHIYDLSTKKLVDSLSPTIDDFDLEQIQSIKLSPDDKVILIQSVTKVTSRLCEDASVIISLYNIERHQKVFERKHCRTGSIYPKFITIEGKNFLSFWEYEKSSVGFVDAETGEVNYPYQFDSMYSSFDVSSDGRFLINRIQNGDSQIIELQSKEVVNTKQGSVSFINGTNKYYIIDDSFWRIYSGSQVVCEVPMRRGYDYGIISEQGGYLLVNAAYLWNISKCTVEKTFYDFQISSLGRQGSPIFSQDGSTLAVLPRLWNVSTGSIKSFVETNKLEVDGFLIHGLDFMEKHNEVLVLMSDVYEKRSRISFWNVNSGDLIRIQDFDHRIYSLVVGKDETIIYGFTDEGVVLKINSETGNVEKSSQVISDTNFGGLRLSPDGLSLVVLGYIQGYIVHIKFVNPDSLFVVNSVEIDQSFVKSIAFSPNGDGIAIPQDNGEIFVLNTDGQIITKLLGHRQTKSLKAIQKITYIQDGSLLVSSDYKRLRFWNPKNGFLLAELELDFGYNGFSISPDGRLLTFLGDDGIIRVFGVKKYE